MAKIESHPLPPPGHSATTITEADRAEIISQANDVIDYYLNGPGSFAVEGLRKPPSDEPGYDSTVQDLTNFKSSIVNTRQFVDDQSGILNSVVELIERTIKQVQDAADARKFGFRDDIVIPAPATPDSINRARVPLPPGSTDPFAPKDPLSRSPDGELHQIGIRDPFGPQGGALDGSMSPGTRPPSERSRSQAPARPAPLADGQGIRDWLYSVALAPPANLASPPDRRLSPSIGGAAQPDRSLSALWPGPDRRGGSARGQSSPPPFTPVRFPLEALFASDRDRALNQWASSLPRIGASPPTQPAAAIPPGEVSPIARSVPSSLDRSPSGGLLGMIQEYMSDNGY
ncbi:MAG TPA: hypothetical protein VNK51_07020 [Bradyrhizobium sp.]|nr:hypothetical protein [Bradyrhizobium sp.]